MRRAIRGSRPSFAWSAITNSAKPPRREQPGSSRGPEKGHLRTIPPWAKPAPAPGGLSEAQAEPEGLARSGLEEIARKVGLDLPKFRAALDSRKHEQKVKADADIASKAGINGTPGFVINGYFLPGAQPAAAFKKLVKKALAGGKKP